MKKKLLECDRHGLTLFRCKRKNWKRGGKDKAYADEYTEKCLKCISERRYEKQDKKQLNKKKHIVIK